MRYASLPRDHPKTGLSLVPTAHCAKPRSALCFPTGWNVDGALQKFYGIELTARQPSRALPAVI